MATHSRGGEAIAVEFNYLIVPQNSCNNCSKQLQTCSEKRSHAGKCRQRLNLSRTIRPNCAWNSPRESGEREQHLIVVSCCLLILLCACVRPCLRAKTKTKTQKRSYSYCAFCFRTRLSHCESGGKERKKLIEWAIEKPVREMNSKRKRESKTRNHSNADSKWREIKICSLQLLFTYSSMFNIEFTNLHWCKSVRIFANK